MRKALILLVCLTLFVSYGCSPPGKRVNIDWVDFIKLQDIEYWSVQQMDYGRKITKEDIGEVFAVVEFNVAKNVFETDYTIKNGDAAFLEKGTPVHLVKGYSPKFRLAVEKEDGQIILYQVMRNPAARVGSDLIDIAGKVDYIMIGDAKDNKYYIKNKEETTKLFNMVMQAPILQDKKTPDSKEVYYVVFYLKDGTAVGKTYWLKEGEMGLDIMLPKEFGDMITKVTNGR